MNSIEYINKYFNKNTTLKNKLLEFHSSESINIFNLRHFYKMFNNPIIKKLKLVYSQYHSFKEIYNLFNSIIHNGYIFSKFVFYEKKELEVFFKENDLEYKEEHNIIIVEIKNFDELKKFDFNEWCIYRELHYYNKYNGNGNRQFLLFDVSVDGNFILGLTTNTDFSKKVYSQSIRTINKRENENFDIFLKSYKLENVANIYNFVQFNNNLLDADFNLNNPIIFEKPNPQNFRLIDFIKRKIILIENNNCENYNLKIMNEDNEITDEFTQISIYNIESELKEYITDCLDFESWINETKKTLKIKKIYYYICTLNLTLIIGFPSFLYIYFCYNLSNNLIYSLFNFVGLGLLTILLFCHIEKSFFKSIYKYVINTILITFILTSYILSPFIYKLFI